jgi:hypothetical protein
MEAMAQQSLESPTEWRQVHGYAVLCTQGALGEWFTVIPASTDKASELRTRGVRTGSSLSGLEIRAELERMGLDRRDIDRAVAVARAWSTTISGGLSRRGLFR